MTPEIMICLAVLGVAVVLFTWDRISAEIVALGVLLALTLSQVIDTETAFAGFGSTTVMMILGLFIMTAGLSNTGIVDTVGRAILSRVGTRPAVLLVTIMVAVSILSAFISNTAATAFFIPVVLGFAAKNKTSPSRYLLPLAFSSILTSSVSLISTSTNLVISEMLVRFNQPAMGMFELAPAGIPIAVAGLIYMLTLGIRLMPNREKSDTSLEDVGNRVYQADLIVPENSALIDKTVGESPIGKTSGLKIVKIIRNGQPLDTVDDGIILQSGDEIVVEGGRKDLLEIKGISGIEIKADLHLADPTVEKEEMAIVEGVLMPNSPLIGHSIRSSEFNDRYGLQVLGINRAIEDEPPSHEAWRRSVASGHA
jgi:di/tricarboxylate transporter